MAQKVTVMRKIITLQFGDANWEGVLVGNYSLQNCDVGAAEKMEEEGCVVEQSSGKRLFQENRGPLHSNPSPPHPWMLCFLSLSLSNQPNASQISKPALFSFLWKHENFSSIFDHGPFSLFKFKTKINKMT